MTNAAKLNYCKLIISLSVYRFRQSIILHMYSAQSLVCIYTNEYYVKNYVCVKHKIEVTEVINTKSMNVFVLYG